MIRGISRQIIEISQTENNYFEKAWLVVKPEYQNVGADKLEREADRCLQSIKPPYSMRNSKGFIFRLISLCSAAIGGGILTAGIMLSYNM